MGDEADINELINNLSALQAENEMLHKLIVTDPSMSGMLRVIKQQGREIDVLRERSSALMEEKNDAIRVSKGALKTATKAVRKLVGTE